MTEKELRERALLYDCPDCGAKAGGRCGWWQELVQNPGYPQRRRWKHTPKPHSERCLLALRADAQLMHEARNPAP